MRGWLARHPRLELELRRRRLWRWWIGPWLVGAALMSLSLFVLGGLLLMCSVGIVIGYGAGRADEADFRYQLDLECAEQQLERLLSSAPDDASDDVLEVLELMRSSRHEIAAELRRIGRLP